MSIKDLGGRLQSERTPEEIARLIQEQFELLSEEEREAVRLCLQEQEDPAYTEQENPPTRIYDVLRDGEYLHEPVDIETFVKDPYYLGRTCDMLYPKLVEDMKELFSGGYGETILTGSIGLDALVQEADGGLPTLGERIGVDSDVVVLLDDGQDFSTTEPGHHSGIKEVLRLTLANGMRVDLTPDHEIQVCRDGVQWVPAEDIQEDDLVLCARHIETKPSAQISVEDARLLGYWVGDGSSSETRARFCDGNPVTTVEVLSLLRELGFDGRRDRKGDNCWEIYVRNAKTSGFLEWLKRNDADRATYDVIIPNRVCRASNEIVAEFLSRLWACEGSVYCPPSGCSPPRFVLGMVSERFVRQVQLLLLRFGIQARIRETDYTDKRNGAERKIWHLQVSGIGQLRKFLDAIGDIPGKEDACHRIRTYCSTRKANTNVDCLPITWGWLNDRMVELGLKRKVGNPWWKLGAARGRRLSRDMFAAWLDSYGDTGLALQLKKSFPESTSYERVASIEPLMVAIPVGDIGAHNGNRFLAQGIQVHNSIGWGKCLRSDTFIELASGETAPIQSLVGKRPFVKSEYQGDLVSVQAAKVWWSGKKECSRLILSSGKTLEASSDHPVLTRRGYVAIGKLERVDEVAVVDNGIGWSSVSDVVGIGIDDVYDLTVPGTENAVANNVIVHNTFFASIAFCRILYELSCMRDPHRSFGIAPSTDISLIVLSVKEDLAIKVAFENIIAKIKESPYFLDNFPYKALKKEIVFPKNIMVAARASTDSAALGLNVYSAFIDEGNFMPEMKKKDSISARVGAINRAQYLYNQLLRRMKSRFQKHGKMPGMMIVVSSKQTKSDFTAKRVRESKDDPTVFVRDYATWHVKDGAFSEETFHVLVGNDLVPSKILTPEDHEVMKDKLQDGLVIVEVPEDYREDFEQDLENAIRDIAGVETVAVSPFIQQRDKIASCVDTNRGHPFTVEEWVQNEGGNFIWTKLAHQVEMRNGAELFESWQPVFFPGVSRHIHIDPSLNSDSTGFAMGCVTGYKTVTRRDEETKEIYTEPAPVIWVDFMLRIVPPIGGEIDHGKVRGLVYQFQRHGFMVGLVTMDQFNCLARGTRISTHRGLLPIEEVIEGDVVESRIGPRKVAKTWSYGKRPTLRLTTQDGDVIEGTLNHRIEVQSGWTSLKDTEYGRTKEPIWEWKQFGEIKVGDVVHMADKPSEFDAEDADLIGEKGEFGWRPERQGRFSGWSLPKKMSPDFSRLLGYMWGNGDIQEKFIRVSMHVDDVDDVRGLFMKVFGDCPDDKESSATDKCRYIRLCATWLVRWMKVNGMKKRSVPECVLRGSRSVKAAFLDGLFSADGGVCKNDGSITLATSDRLLAEHVRLLLRVDFGIESCLVTVPAENTGSDKWGIHSDRDHFKVSVRGPRERFLDRVGLSCTRKRLRMESFREVKGRRKFVKVTAIEQSSAEVFDLQVEDDHSYIANGFVSHNSAPSLQKFATKGIEAERLSVDKPMDAYDTLKTAIYEGRINYYGYNPVLEELRNVQRDNLKNKVDHPASGSKDVADALAGIVYTLSTRYHGPPMGIIKGVSQYADPAVNEQHSMLDDDRFMLPFVTG